MFPACCFLQRIYVAQGLGNGVHTHEYIYIYIYIYISSSCRTASMDIPDPLSPLLPIIHRLRQVFKATSCVLT